MFSGAIVLIFVMIFDIQGAWIDCACNKVLGNCSQDWVGALSPFEVSV